MASPDTVKWSRVNIPTDGEAGQWLLASGSDIQHPTLAVDSTLYAYGKGLSYTLYKSTDGGASWLPIGKVKDAIVDIATAPDDAKVVYYATSSHIYQSTDGGESFLPLPLNPGGAGGNNIEITCIDVSKDVAEPTTDIIVVSTRDKDKGEFGGVYLLNAANPFTWTDTEVGNYDVYAVAFSPNYPDDMQLVAVVTDEVDTIVTSKIGDEDWGASIGDATLNKDNSRIPTPVAVDTSASIAFPSDYNSDVLAGAYVQFVAIDAGDENGDVYLIEGVQAPSRSLAADLDIGWAYGLRNVDVTGLAISGNAATANLIAGAAGSANIYFSADGGKNWEQGSKPPTGEFKTYVLMAADFADSSIAYAASSGAESAFSVTRDGGITWNQTSLIDTKISDIVDLAPSPSYSQDNTLFMLTHQTGGEHSLWRSLNGGTSWERVYTSGLANVDEIDRVELPPQYDDNRVVFIAGSSNGKPAIWKSTDNGQSFKRKTVPFPINTWVVVDDTTLFIGSFDDGNGLVYRTTNSGLTFSEGAIAGSQSLNSIALSPDYDEDETILVGNKDGWVYWSEDNGVSFKPLPPHATTKPLSGSITIAFDPRYSTNNTVYAASDTADKGIYRFIIGKSDAWETIDSPTGGMIGQMIVSDEGTLYAANFKAGGGMERCLNPTYPLGPTFETVTKGLDDGAKLIGLWLHDHRLWSIDTANTKLMTYTDSLTQPVTLTSPPDRAPGAGTIIDNTVKNVSLNWETLDGATEYEWQLDYDTDFSSVPAGFEGTTKASSAQLPALDLATTYYWRVRATEPVLSPWSAKWSFTTSLGTEAVAPRLDSPEGGARGVPVKPIFQWSAIAGADSYELVVSTEANLDNPTILKTGTYALPTTAWQCNIALNHDTTYYWKVRAISADTCSAWSAVSAFTTEPPPQPASPPQPPQPDATEWIKWLVPLGGVLLLTFLVTMIAMLITMIILTIKVLKL
jgi:photosystem II stability/assembly factor-like uncharacterized protein